MPKIEARLDLSDASSRIDDFEHGCNLETNRSRLDKNDHVDDNSTVRSIKNLTILYEFVESLLVL